MCTFISSDCAVYCALRTGQNFSISVIISYIVINNSLPYPYQKQLRQRRQKRKKVITTRHSENARYVSVKT